MKVRLLEKDVFMVESQGTSGEGLEEYRVDLSDEYFGCSCKSYQFHHEYQNVTYGLKTACKHILAAQRYKEQSDVKE